MKYSQKDPRTNSYYWQGSVISTGGKEFIEKEASSAHLQVTGADGTVNLVPVVQRLDPDQTVYENISQILLNEDNENQCAEKVKLVTSSQEEKEICYSSQEPNSWNDGNYELEQQQPCVTLTPDEVSRYLSQVERSENDRNQKLNGSGLANNPDLNYLGEPKTVDGNFEQPKHSSTPANRKVKRSKVINPEDITEMKVRRADLEAAHAIKDAASENKQAAIMIVNCMQELKPEIKSLSNRNYRQIQMSTNAMKQLVSFCQFSY